MICLPDIEGPRDEDRLAEHVDLKPDTCQIRNKATRGHYVFGAVWAPLAVPSDEIGGFSYSPNVPPSSVSSIAHPQLDAAHNDEHSIPHCDGTPADIVQRRRRVPMPPFKRERRSPISNTTTVQSSSSSTLSGTSSTTLASSFDKHQYQRPPSPSSHSTSSSSHHSHTNSAARSRKSSQSLPENTQRSPATRRTSHSVSSQLPPTGVLLSGNAGAKRSPLAPLDPQAATQHDIVLMDINTMMNGGDQEMDGGRKSSTYVLAFSLHFLF